MDLLLAAGVQALQITPLVTRSGMKLGMFSTLCRRPHRPDARTLSLLDLLARQAADLIERTQSETAFQQSEARLRLAARAARVGLWDWDLRNRRLRPWLG